SLSGVTGTIALNASTGIQIATSGNVFSIQNTGVTSFNGGTGAQTGVGTVASGTNISVSNATGSVTINFVNPGFLTNASVTALSPVVWSSTSTISCPTCSVGTWVTTSSNGIQNALPIWASASALANSLAFQNANGTSFFVSSTPTATATLSLFALGPNAISNGQASGTWFGILNATSSNADLLNFETYVTSTANGVSVFRVASSGALTVPSLTDTGVTNAILATNGSGLIVSTSSYVSSFNGSTGTVTGVGSLSGVTGTIALNASTGIQIATSGNVFSIQNTGVTSFNGGTGAQTGVGTVASGTNISVSNATGSVTINFVNPGFVTAASSVNWTAAQTFVATATFQSSTI